MNNNKKNLQPNNTADGDNSINTKKGFLISFPSKKKSNEETASGIVMAKTINEKPAEKTADGEKEQNKDRNNRRNNRNRNHKVDRNQNAKPDADKSAVNETKQESNTNTKKTETHPTQKDSKQNRNDRNGRGNKNSKHDRNDRPQKNKEQQPQKNDSQQKQKNQQSTQNVGNQLKNKQNEQKNLNQKNQRNDRDRKNADKRDRNDRNDKNGKNNKKIELPGLSPLSKDMRDYAKISKSDIEKTADAGKKEPSLEEKYKNATPLADQIAAEEFKRRMKPKAMVTNTIDRSSTGNQALSAIIAEAGEDAKITVPDDGREFEVVGIRFREAGKVYYFDPDEKDIPFGTPVIVETARGAEYGYTAISNRLVPHTSVIPPLKKIKRIATAADTEKYIANKSLEADAAEIFRQKVAALGLEMNLIFVEYTFDNSKLLFYFTAETRIDFRELVKELASVFRTRIELRQIGVRDEAKMLGGIGVCGRSVCCNSFLGDFAQVSIKMAKDQGLSLNSAKISGACGKLMCCLRYEDKVYEEEMARTPKVGSVVETAEGKGVVTEALPLKGIVKVTLEASPETPPKPFNRDDVKVVGFNKAAVKEDAEEMKELKALEDNN